MRGVLLCVQDFVRSPHFSQRNFFSESGLTMLSESVAIAESITSSPVCALWSVVESACASQVITGLCACWDRVMLRRRTAKDKWYHGGSPRGETKTRPAVRISGVVEEGRVECVPVDAPSLGPPGPSKMRSSSSKPKSKISRSPVKLPRRFEVSSPRAEPPRRSLVEDPGFASALATPASHGKSRRSDFKWAFIETVFCNLRISCFPLFCASLDCLMYYYLILLYTCSNVVR